MKKEKLQKLKLNKKIVAALSKKESKEAVGGAWTTSFTYCTGFLCCNTGDGGTGSNGGVCTMGNCETC